MCDSLSGKKSKPLSFSSFSELESMNIDEVSLGGKNNFSSSETKDHISKIMDRNVLIRLMNSATGEPFSYVTDRQDLRCWWCTIPMDINHIVCGCPCIYDEEIETFYIYGSFCCWECVLAYSNRRDNDISDQRLRHMWMRKIWVQEPWNVDYSIKEAPPHTLLQDYGGPFDYEMYKTHIVKQRNDKRDISLSYKDPSLRNYAIANICPFAIYREDTNDFELERDDKENVPTKRSITLFKEKRDDNFYRNLFEDIDEDVGNESQIVDGLEKEDFVQNLSISNPRNVEEPSYNTIQNDEPESQAFSSTSARFARFLKRK